MWAKDPLTGAHGSSAIPLLPAIQTRNDIVPFLWLIAMATAVLRFFRRRCFLCGENLFAKVPFEYSDFQFCSIDCVKQHKKNNKSWLRRHNSGRTWKHAGLERRHDDLGVSWALCASLRNRVLLLFAHNGGELSSGVGGIWIPRVMCLWMDQILWTLGNSLF